MPMRLLTLLLLAGLAQVAGASPPEPSALLDELVHQGMYAADRARIDAARAATPSGDPNAPAFARAALAARILDGDWVGDAVVAEIDAVVREHRARFGPGSPATLDAELRGAELRLARGEYGAARDALEAVASRAEALPDLHRRALVSLGRLYAELGEFPSAEARLQEAATLPVEPKSLDAAELAFATGRLELARNRIGPATAQLETAITIRTERLGPEHPLVADAVAELGMLHRTTGNYRAMWEHFERARTIWEARLRPGHPSLARSLEQQGYYAALVEADLPRARQLFERAARAMETAFGARHPEVGRAWYGQAYTLYHVGEHWRTAELLRATLELWQTTLGERHPRTADVYKFMAISARNDRPPDLARARQLFETAIDIWVDAVGREHSQVAVSMINVAEICNELGAYEDASRFASEAYEIWTNALGSQHPFIAWCHNIMGRTTTLSGRFDEAVEHYQQAGRIFERALAPFHYELTENLQDFAIALLKKGEDQRCVEVAQQAEANARQLLRLTSLAVSERELLSYATQRKAMDGLDVLLSLAAQEDPDPAVVDAGLDALIRSRVFALDEVASRHRSLVTSDDPDTARMVRELRELREELSLRVVQGPQGDPDAFHRGFRALRDRKEQLERALAERSAEMRRRRARDEIGLAAVREALGPDQALVAVSRYRHHERAPTTAPRAHYLAFVSTASAPVRVVSLGPAEALDQAVRVWHEDLRARPTGLGGWRQREARHRERGERLSEMVWDPVAPHLGSSRTVFVVPDGSLHMVNLSALPSGPDRYLVEEDLYLHILSSERDLVTLRQRGAPGEGLLALGGVDYDALPGGTMRSPAAGSGLRGPSFFGERLRREDFTSTVFSPLPATSSEVDAVLELWDAHVQTEPPLVLRALEATEEAFKRLAASRRVIHVATHAFFLGVGDAPDENPLLLSGLALAGANQRDGAQTGEEDGILTAEEIATLDLSSTEWAVLSACDSGVGDIAFDQGVTGLRRAFETAGVGTLIMSLWPVDDRATMAWMQALYEQRLQRGASTVASVRSATRQILASRRKLGTSTHPFYWGAFVAAGDWR